MKPPKDTPPLPPSASPWGEEEPVQQIPYPVMRRALGKSGPVRIAGLELSRASDAVVLRPVNPRHHPLPQFIEVPWRPAVLRQLARVLADWADQADQEDARLRRRLQAVGERQGSPTPPATRQASSPSA
jgi:hypothetical protein